MKYMLLIHQGTTPLPGTEEWNRLSGRKLGPYAVPGASAPHGRASAQCITSVTCTPAYVPLEA